MTKDHSRIKLASLLARRMTGQLAKVITVSTVLDSKTKQSKAMTRSWDEDRRLHSGLYQQCLIRQMKSKQAADPRERLVFEVAAIVTH